MQWRERGGVSWQEHRLPGATAAFSARLGGVSNPPFGTLNLAVKTGDRPERVRENRRRLATALALEPERFVIGRQVHGALLAAHDGPQRPAPFVVDGADPPEVDGHHTREPDLPLLVFVADCVPIAIDGARGAAVLHGGWRGLAAGIVERGVAAVEGRAAAIGPGIGRCCYEVGAEVLEAFAPLGPGVADGRMLDLTEVAARLLRRAGVEEVASSGLCTRCNPDLFFSHRGEGPRTGRQAGVVWRRA